MQTAMLIIKNVFNVRRCDVPALGYHPNFDHEAIFRVIYLGSDAEGLLLEALVGCCYVLGVWRRFRKFSCCLEKKFLDLAQGKDAAAILLLLK